MKRIGILTAGGDTPALNATIAGAVHEANRLRIEVVGIVKGFSGLLDPRVPHVRLNPLFAPIPELDPTRGGTILGASREYVSGDDAATLERVAARLRRLGIEGLICVGGDGTINGMQALSNLLPVVLAPKTIDNDLGLNYPDESHEWVRETDPAGGQTVRYRKGPGRAFGLDEMVNYVTPGFATAVAESAASVLRVRTTAESHRRVAIVEVMGRDCGMIALGTAYGQPDILLVPESPVRPEPLVERVRAVLDVQKHAVIVVSEGIVDEHGHIFGSVTAVRDPAGNLLYSGAAEAIKKLIVGALGDAYFTRNRRNESAEAAVFVRKVGHTQRGGRPILFDRFYGAQLGGKAVGLLVEGYHNCVAALQYRDGGFVTDAVHAHRLRDRWGVIHARPLSASFYDAERFRPSARGVEYLHSVFTNAMGVEDAEAARDLFDTGNIVHPYDSVTVHISKRIVKLDPDADADTDSAPGAGG